MRGLGCELAEFNSEAEHVHLLVNFPPTVAISSLVNSLKGVSSGGCGQSSPICAGTTDRRNGCDPDHTSPESVGGAPITALHHYIEQQHRPP